jgi:chromosome segregation ATPase
MSQSGEVLATRLSADLLESERVRDQLMREMQSLKDSMVSLRRENTTLAKSREELAKQLKQTREELREANEDAEDAGGINNNTEELRAQVSALEEQVRFLQGLGEYPAPEATSTNDTLAQVNKDTLYPLLR